MFICDTCHEKKYLTKRCESSFGKGRNPCEVCGKDYDTTWECTNCKIQYGYTNCMDCPFSSVEWDPDPYDDFCDDDQAVLCTKMRRYVTKSCRPYQKREECETPDWCPLQLQKKEN